MTEHFDIVTDVGIEEDGGLRAGRVRQALARHASDAAECLRPVLKSEHFGRRGSVQLSADVTVRGRLDNVMLGDTAVPCFASAFGPARMPRPDVGPVRIRWYVNFETRSREPTVGEHQRAEHAAQRESDRAAGDDILHSVCDAVRDIAEANAEIAEENRIGEASGAVSLGRLRDAGVKKVYAQDAIKEARAEWQRRFPERGALERVACGGVEVELDAVDVAKR